MKMAVLGPVLNSLSLTASHHKEDIQVIGGSPGEGELYTGHRCKVQPGTLQY